VDRLGRLEPNNPKEPNNFRMAWDVNKIKKNFY
jgi:hypothetical protein